MSVPYNRKMIPRAKELRSEMTPQERKLWYNYLRKFKYRVQRQKTIGGFIADFYCHEARMAIEVDGLQHYTSEGLIYDRDRTIEFEKLYVKVIRFSNYDVDNRFCDVCRAIEAEAEKRRTELASIGRRKE